MDTYLLVHRHPDNYAGSPEAAAAWEAWFDKLGGAVEVGRLTPSPGVQHPARTF